MKKLLLLILLINISCGSRKKTLEIQKQETEISAGQNLSKTEETKTASETTFDFSKLMENESISIASDGNPYILNYRGLFYSGSSPIEISNKKEEVKTKIVQKVETIYKSVIQFKTETTYKTQTLFKSKETERKSYPWYWIVLGTILIWELLKLATKKYRGNFLESL